MMPFSCRVAGGQPVLTPSGDEAYRILGQHEQRAFTACSPVSPEVCRQWTLHRFDLDCGGARVPWVSVATAADGPGNGRAWVEDGRVRIRMGPWWNIAPGDPCARQPMYGDRWQSGRFSRYCADRRAAMQPAVVELPFGFAPMLGTKGAFVAAAGPRPGAIPSDIPRVAAAPAPSPAVRGEPIPRPRSEATPRDAAPKDVPAKSKPARLAEVPPPPPPAADVSTPATTPGTPAKPTIINRIEPSPEPPPVAALPREPAPSKEPAPGPEGAAKFAAHVPIAAKEAAVPNGPREEATGESAKPITVNLLSAIANPSTTAVIAFTVLAMLAIAGLAWLLRRERTPFASAAPRDFASVSLGGPRRDGNISTAGSLVVGSSGRPSPNVRPHAVRPAQSGGALAGLGDAIPRTKAEALQVLGMGVTADAAEAAIKRIVDGLRLSWHPDYAKDPEDRRIRELRVKQINAAWEIIRGKRAEA
jgi:hypothetical protein